MDKYRYNVRVYEKRQRKKEHSECVSRTNENGVQRSVRISGSTEAGREKRKARAKQEID